MPSVAFVSIEKWFEDEKSWENKMVRTVRTRCEQQSNGGALFGMWDDRATNRRTRKAPTYMLTGMSRGPEGGIHGGLSRGRTLSRAPSRPDPLRNLCGLRRALPFGLGNDPNMLGDLWCDSVPSRSARRPADGGCPRRRPGDNALRLPSASRCRVRRPSTEKPILAMPLQRFVGRRCRRQQRRPDHRPLKVIVVLAVVEVRLQPAAHDELQVLVDRHIAEVE